MLVIVLVFTAFWVIELYSYVDLEVNLGRIINM